MLFVFFRNHKRRRGEQRPPFSFSFVLPFHSPFFRFVARQIPSPPLLSKCFSHRRRCMYSSTHHQTVGPTHPAAAIVLLHPHCRLCLVRYRRAPESRPDFHECISVRPHTRVAVDARASSALNHRPNSARNFSLPFPHARARVRDA